MQVPQLRPSDRAERHRCLLVRPVVPPAPSHFFPPFFFFLAPVSPLMPKFPSVAAQGYFHLRDLARVHNDDNFSAVESHQARRHRGAPAVRLCQRVSPFVFPLQQWNVKY